MSMSLTNTVINASSEVARAAGSALASFTGPPVVRNLGTYNTTTDEAQRVSLMHNAMGNMTNIFANTPPNFNLELQADWAQRNGAGTLRDAVSGYAGAKGGNAASAVAGRALDATGLSSTTLKYMTAHYWEGSAPIRCTLPFEFIAESDPEREVVQPLIHLYKMAAPLEVGGVLIPPGPSVIGTALGGERITIKIGDVITFDNVVINNVSGEIDTRLTFSGKLLHAKVDVSFTSFFTVSRADIEKMFGASGSSSAGAGYAT